MASASPMPRGARCTLCTGPVTVTSRAETPGICSPGNRSGKRFNNSGMTRAGKKWNKVERSGLNFALSFPDWSNSIIPLPLPSKPLRCFFDRCLFWRAPLSRLSLRKPHRGDEATNVKARIPTPALAPEETEDPDWLQEIAALSSVMHVQRVASHHWPKSSYPRKHLKGQIAQASNNVSSFHVSDFKIDLTGGGWHRWHSSWPVYSQNRESHRITASYCWFQWRFAAKLSNNWVEKRSRKTSWPKSLYKYQKPAKHWCQLAFPSPRASNPRLLACRPCQLPCKLPWEQPRAMYPVPS